MLCEKCNKEIPNNAPFCEFCGAPVENHPIESPVTDIPVSHPAEVKKPENVVAGIVGAFLGALIGAFVIVLLGQLGYIASLSGLVLAVCTLKGYELLGGQLSSKGIVISILLILVTPYLADRVNWALAIMDAIDDATFGEAFAIVHPLISELELTADYLKDLLMLYLFAVLGAGSTISQAIKARKTTKE